MHKNKIDSIINEEINDFIRYNTINEGFFSRNKGIEDFDLDDNGDISDIDSRQPTRTRSQRVFDTVKNGGRKVKDWFKTTMSRSEEPEDENYEEPKDENSIRLIDDNEPSGINFNNTIDLGGNDNSEDNGANSENDIEGNETNNNNSNYQQNDNGNEGGQENSLNSQQQQNDNGNEGRQEDSLNSQQQRNDNSDEMQYVQNDPNQRHPLPNQDEPQNQNNNGSRNPNHVNINDYLNVEEDYPISNALYRLAQRRYINQERALHMIRQLKAQGW